MLDLYYIIINKILFIIRENAACLESAVWIKNEKTIPGHKCIYVFYSDKLLNFSKYSN